MLRFTISLDQSSDGTLETMVAQGYRQCGGSSGSARAVILQGSVWLGNRRVKTPDITLTGLRSLARQMQADANRRHQEKKTEIQVFWPEKPISEFTMDPSQVIWEDDHLLIAYKPAGLNTCQSVFSDTNCLTWGVQKLLDARAGIRSDPLDTEAELPGRYVVRTINRLDYATRGLVFYAKHKEAEKALHRMFMERRVHKRYLVGTAPLAAPLAAASSRLAGGDPAAWQPGHSLVIRDPVEWQGKVQSAVTLVRLLARTPERWWWAALPQTGRTHQIRKHFAGRLAPIEGDLSYGGGQIPDAGVSVGSPAEDDAEAAASGSDPDSLLLACVAYRFRHPISGQALRISRLPPEFLSDYAFPVPWPSPTPASP